jgi:putative acetyltransferase
MGLDVDNASKLPQSKLPTRDPFDLNALPRTLMITDIRPQHDRAVADFWVQAWQATLVDVDFEARRPWILAHLATMRENGQVVRGYFAHNDPIGFYSLFQDTGLIEQICVGVPAKGRGIGAALIVDAAMQTDQRLNLVVNEDNHSARQFYAKLGFTEAGRGVNPASSRPTITLEMTAKTAS